MNKSHTTYSQFDFVLFLLTSFLLYVFSPTNYSYSFCLVCFILYICSTIIYLTAKHKINLFDFDVLFLVSCLFVFFIYPVFIYPIFPDRYLLFSYDFNEKLISKGCILSLLGCQSYMLGGLSLQNYNGGNRKRYRIVATKKLYWLLWFFFLSFILVGGLSNFQALYKGEQTSSAPYYVMLPIVPLFIVIFANNNYQENNNTLCLYIKKNKQLLIFAIVYFVSLLLVGSRTTPIQIILVCIAIYSMKVKPINRMKIVMLILIGIALLFAIQLLREESSNVEGFYILDLFSDLIINNRSTFVVMDYVNNNGITWGKSMLGPLLAPIPFLQTVFCTIFEINPTEISSAQIVTFLALGKDPSMGFGTNIVADLYLSYGLIGVLIGMFLLGRITEYWFISSHNNFISWVCYLVMMSYAVYIVRAEFFFPQRFLIWAVFLIYLMHPKSNRSLS